MQCCRGNRGVGRAALSPAEWRHWGLDIDGDVAGGVQGAPREDDVVVHALPVCAPYQVLAPYRHKVKLTPGPQKKGKAARQVLAAAALLPLPPTASVTSAKVKRVLPPPTPPHPPAG